MSDDRSLLEAAARAAGIEGEWEDHPANEGVSTSGIYIEGRAMLWNPLVDDGDALRLAVTLKMKITPSTEAISAETSSVLEYVSRQGNDDAAVTRRVIVLCAAAIALNFDY